MRRVWIPLALLLAACGCTTPVYSHTVITKYDADGNIIGSEEIESMSQATSFGAPFSVRITQREKLEE